MNMNDAQHLQQAPRLDAAWARSAACFRLYWVRFTLICLDT
jgi:hypothetical protein